MSSKMSLLWTIESAPSPDTLFYDGGTAISVSSTLLLLSDTATGVMLSLVVGGAAIPNWTGETITSSTFIGGACAKPVHEIKYKIS